ncbi:MAG: class D sortase [Acidobacteriota bacterium]|nr:class D sortase [Acidobacteriota bacterium]
MARLLIPRLKADLYIIEGTNQRELHKAPGHMEGTSLPGEKGNCVIAGHRDTHFRVLQNIRPGEEIVLENTRGRQFRYRVTQLSVVSPANTKCLQDTSEPVLNLITCYPFHYVGSAPKRFVVHAELEPPTPSQSGT